MRFWKMAFAGLAGLAFAVGCDGRDSGDGTGPGEAPDLSALVEISITPADQSLEVNGAEERVITYSAVGRFSDGRNEDISRAVAFKLDPQIGVFEGTTLKLPADRGGASTVTAIASTGTSLIQATARLRVSVRRSFTDPISAGLPSDVADKFAGPEVAAKAPELVYPNDGVLLPPNLNRLEIHFRPKVGTSLYQLTLANEVTDVKVHLACYRPAGVPEGCIYETDPAVWKAVAETNRGGAPVTLTVKATDANGAEVGTSASLTFSFARDDLEGGLYYWTTSEGGGIMRFDFADPTQTQAVKFVGNELSGGGCGVGCHALSRDGKKIVAQKGGSQSGDLLLLDVAKYEPIVPFPAAGKSVFESWSPDASQFAGVYAARASGNPSPSTDWNLRIHDGETGAVAASVAGTGSVEQPANHPDWSPDGRTIAYVKMGDRGSDLTISNQKFFGGALFTVSREGNAWSAPKLLLSAAAGKNRYYPAFAPDSSFVVFDESTCAAGQPKDRNCNADSDPSAKVFALSTAEGAAPIPLTQANAPGKLDANANLTNSFPKWSPFVFRRTSEGGRLNWLTFSSSRNYGLRTPVAGAPDENPRGTLLWMTAIDPDKVAAGQDPSYSAFALPFQDLNTSNHIGQWTEKVVPRIR